MKCYTMKQFSNMKVADLVSDLEGDILEHDQGTVEVFDPSTGSVTFWTLALQIQTIKKPNAPASTRVH